MMRRLILLAALLLPTACSHHHRGNKDKDVDKDDPRKDESKEDREARLKREAAIAAKQKADAAKFQKALEVVKTIKVGDRDTDFYRKVTDARLYLERTNTTVDGEVQRYAFADSSTAFLIVVIRDAHLTEIRTEGVEP